MNLHRILVSTKGLFLSKFTPIRPESSSVCLQLVAREVQQLQLALLLEVLTPRESVRSPAPAWLHPGFSFMSAIILSRSSSGEVRIRVPFFSVVYFSRGTLPPKRNSKRAPSWGTQL